MSKFSRSFCVAACLGFLPLAACSNEPTDADIQQALQNSIKNIPNSPLSFLLDHDAKPGEGLTPKLLESKKIGCVEARAAPGYNCDYQIKVRTFGIEETEMKTRRFFKTPAGYAIGEVS